MEPSIETWPEQAVAYLRRIGPYGGENRALMEQLKAWAARQGLLEGGVFLGVAWDDPARTPPERCRYDVCLAVTAPPPGGPSAGRLPGGRYACFQGPHTPQGVLDLWQTAFPALAAAGWSPDPARPVVERYAPELLGRGLCELCVPV